MILRLMNISIDNESITLLANMNPITQLSIKAQSEISISILNYDEYNTNRPLDKDLHNTTVQRFSTTDILFNASKIDLLNNSLNDDSYDYYYDYRSSELNDAVSYFIKQLLLTYC